MDTKDKKTIAETSTTNAPTEETNLETLPDMAPLQDQEEILRKEAIEAVYPQPEPATPWENAGVLSSRMLCGALVGLALGCLYALYTTPQVAWLGGGLAYGFITGLAWIFGGGGARASLKYVAFDGPIAAMLIIVLTVFSPVTVLSMLTKTLFTDTFYSGLYLGMIAACVIGILAFTWHKTRKN